MYTYIIVIMDGDFSGDKGSAASLGYAMLRINDLFVKELEEDAKFK